MTLGKYNLKKVVAVCDYFEISWLEQFPIKAIFACVTPHGGYLLLALSAAWVLERKEQGQL